LQCLPLITCNIQQHSSTVSTAQTSQGVAGPEKGLAALAFQVALLEMATLLDIKNNIKALPPSGLALFLL
jgi:hypothetical protein